MQASLDGAERHLPTPDTGSLRTDLPAYAESLAEASKSDYARAVFYSLIPPSKDWDPTEVQSDFWDIRFEKVATILRRAADRGELRPGIDPLEAVRMLSTALRYDILFTNSAVRPDYAAQVLDIFIRGIIQNSGNNSGFRAFGFLPGSQVCSRVSLSSDDGHCREGPRRFAPAKPPRTPSGSWSGTSPASLSMSSALRSSNSARSGS